MVWNLYDTTKSMKIEPLQNVMNSIVWKMKESKINNSEIKLVTFMYMHLKSDDSINI